MDASNLVPTEPDQGSYYPDGLTSVHIDQLLADAEVHWSTAPRPTAAFLDGTADLRRERRNMRRATGAVVRALPSRPTRDFLAADGEVA